MSPTQPFAEWEGLKTMKVIHPEVGQGFISSHITPVLKMFPVDTKALQFPKIKISFSCKYILQVNWWKSLPKRGVCFGCQVRDIAHTAHVSSQGLYRCRQKKKKYTFSVCTINEHTQNFGITITFHPR